jgi:hypothetical protein
MCLLWVETVLDRPSCVHQLRTLIRCQLGAGLRLRVADERLERIGGNSRLAGGQGVEGRLELGAQCAGMSRLQPQGSVTSAIGTDVTDVTDVL